MTTPNQKLTLADIETIAARHDRPSMTEIAWLARALLAYDKALRQARSDLIVAGMFDSAKEVEAVLLPKGEDDAGNNSS